MMVVWVKPLSSYKLSDVSGGIIPMRKNKKKNVAMQLKLTRSVWACIDHAPASHTRTHRTSRTVPGVTNKILSSFLKLHYELVVFGK